MSTVQTLPAPEIPSKFLHPPIKMLVVGDTGGGKSGALASLAEAGYNLRVLNFDNGLDILIGFLTDLESPYVIRNKGQSLLSQLDYITLTETSKLVGNKLIKGAQVWEKASKLLFDWDNDGKKLGSIFTWTSREILVVDTLTRLSDAAMNRTLSMNNHLGQNPTQPEWGSAQQLVETFLATLYDDSVPCNVIVNCHVRYMELPTGGTQGYPLSLGKALSPRIGTYFNSCIHAQNPKIYTQTRGVIPLKNVAPWKIPKELPLESGLATYFQLVRGN